MLPLGILLVGVLVGGATVVAAPRDRTGGDGRSSLDADLDETSSLLRGGGWVQRGPRPLLCICLSYIFMNTLLMGMHLGLPNPMVVSLMETHELNAWQVGVLASVGPLFTAIASLGAGVFADARGRRPLAAMSVVLALCGSGVLAVAVTYKELVAGRILHGLSIGSAMISTCLYTAEVSPSNWRGALGTFTEVSINAGILLVMAGVYIVSQGLQVSADADWRWIVHASLVLAVVLLALVQFLPESPRWLAARGRLEEATVTLQSLLTDQAEVQAVIRGLADQAGVATASYTMEDTRRLARTLCLMDPQMRLPVLRAEGMAFFHMATGVMLPGVFGTLLLEQRYGKALAQFGTFLMCIFKMAAILVSAMFVDSCGRLPLLLGSCALMGTGYVLWALIWVLPGAPFSWTLLGMTISVVGFSFGLGPLNYVVPAEVLPLHLRAVGVAACNVLCRVAEATVTFSILPVVQACGLVPVLGYFAVTCFAAAIFFQMVMPESKQLTLEKSSEA